MPNTSNSGYLYMKYYLHILPPLMHFYIKCITYDYSIDIGKEISSFFYITSCVLIFLDFSVHHRCSCGNCALMPSIQQSKCCQETNIVDGKIEEAGISCITHHEGFHPNFLNIHVLEISYYEYLQDNGPLQDHEKIHE